MFQVYFQNICMFMLYYMIHLSRISPFLYSTFNAVVEGIKMKRLDSTHFIDDTKGRCNCLTNLQCDLLKLDIHFCFFFKY